MRLGWDDTWMQVAEVISKRSRCDNRQVGAVVVDSRNRPVATGYNGPAAGFPIVAGQTCSSWCPRRIQGILTPSYDSCVSIHAEANALMFADRRDYDGGTLYVTSSCCWDCGKMIANSGVKRVVMKLSPNDAHRLPKNTIDHMQMCGLQVDVWDFDE